MELTVALRPKIARAEHRPCESLPYSVKPPSETLLYKPSSLTFMAKNGRVRVYRVQGISRKT